MITATILHAKLSGAEAKPNIVYILADDLGYGDVSCFNDEARVKTPHIDRLASEGMRFKDAHSASACTPSRYGILTGQYAFRSRLPVNVLRPYDPPLIEPDRLTVPELLRRAGYYSACIGKWHLGMEWPEPDAAGVRDFGQRIGNGPVTRGFHEYFGTDVPNHPPYGFIRNDQFLTQPTAFFAGGDREQHLFLKGPMVPGWKFEAIMPGLAQDVDRFLNERARRAEPFFLFYSLTIPHEPLSPSPEFLGKSGINRVADLILQTDAAVGAVLATLDRLGLAHNTIVVFASDNGHGPATGVPALLAAGHDPSRPYRGFKGSLLEGGHRIPFLVRWPDRVAAGTICTEPVALESLLSTCADIVGQTLPETAGEDSYSLLPILLGKKRPDPVHPYLIHAGVRGFAVRRGPWKLVNLKENASLPLPDRPDAKTGLYNIDNDPLETRDLSVERSDVKRELDALLVGAKRGGHARRK